jgi:uncharacterized repeat protein (TIGR03803 family)
MKKQMMQSTLILGLVMSMSGSAANAQTYTPIHNNDETLDGCCQKNPGLLAEGLDGNVYGTNPTELPWVRHIPSIPGDGALISYSPATGAWARYYFQGGADGNSPLSGVTLGADGNLYGATEWGGRTDLVGSGYGTVFSFTPGASASPVHVYEFTNTIGSPSTVIDGNYPWAPPVQTQDGSLWGVSNSGTWYRMNTSGSILNSGTLPSPTQAPMIVSLEQGTLYGTTPNGGTYGKGTVYRLTQAGVFTQIYSFGNPNNQYEGLSPIAPVVEGFDGFLYGTTCWGGKTAGGMNGTGTTGQGTVFRVSRDGSSFSTIYNFQDNANRLDGYCPMAGLVQGNDGMLYGVTSAGGGGSNTAISGTLFRLDTGGGNFQVLHTFDKPNGNSPLSTPLLHTNGKIYGMASAGGSGYGVLYSYDPGLGQAGQFARLVGPWSGPVGTVIGVLGQGFNSATGVLIGGVAVTWNKWSHPVTIVSDAYMLVTVPAGAKNGYVTVQEPTGNLVTREMFQITCTPGTIGCLKKL